MFQGISQSEEVILWFHFAQRPAYYGNQCPFMEVLPLTEAKFATQIERTSHCSSNKCPTERDREKFERDIAEIYHNSDISDN